MNDGDLVTQKTTHPCVCGCGIINYRERLCAACRRGVLRPCIECKTLTNRPDRFCEDACLIRHEVASRANRREHVFR